MRKGLIERITNLLQRPASDNHKQWRRAQQGEYGFWHSVAKTGYGGKSTSDFLSENQSQFMLAQLDFLDKPRAYWHDKVVVEFGPGPAGIVEYMQARRKIAVEPLIDRFRVDYPHLENSEVEYISSAGEEADQIEGDLADLAICFNVLDHTYEPARIVGQLYRICKPGAELLLQVNVYTSADELRLKTGEHAALHPHSFFPAAVVELLQVNGFEIWKQRCDEKASDYGEHFFICAGRKI